MQLLDRWISSFLIAGYPLDILCISTPLGAGYHCGYPVADGYPLRIQWIFGGYPLDAVDMHWMLEKSSAYPLIRRLDIQLSNWWICTGFAVVLTPIISWICTGYPVAAGYPLDTCWLCTGCTGYALDMSLQ